MLRSTGAHRVALAAHRVAHAGVLYLRHACEPRDLWEFLAPHVADAEPIDTLGDGASTTFGKFVCRTMLEPEHVERGGPSPSP